MNTVCTVAGFIHSEYKVLLDFLSMNCNARDMAIIMRHTTHTAPHTTLEKQNKQKGPNNRLSKGRLGFYIQSPNSPSVVVCGLVFHQNPRVYCV